jgi:hypothetical protein
MLKESQAVDTNKQKWNERIWKVHQWKDVVIANGQIGNHQFDETNVNFSFTSNSALTNRGATTESVRMNEKSQQSMAVIRVSGSNIKFSPVVIIKGKDAVIKKTIEWIEQQQETATYGEFEGFPLSVTYAVQERAWMDTAAMNKLFVSVYAPWATAIGGPYIFFWSWTSTGKDKDHRPSCWIWRVC